MAKDIKIPKPYPGKGNIKVPAPYGTDKVKKVLKRVKNATKTGAGMGKAMKGGRKAATKMAAKETTHEMPPKSMFKRAGKTKQHKF